MMQHYMGTKMIEAEPAPAEDGSPGYRVRYPDGYESWSPAETFEAAYLPMTDSDGTRVTQAMVDEFIVSTEVTRLGNHTVVMATCRNGFTIIAESACVDPANYDEGIGLQIAMEKIRKQVWNHLGFVLACGRNGI